MKKIQSALPLLLLLGLLSSTASAQVTGSSGFSQGNVKKITLTCPDTSTIKIKDGAFYSGAHWKSHDKAFVPKLTRFLGAQWNSQGTNIGQLMCIYSVADPQQLPTMLFFNTMVDTPLSGSWAPPPSLSHMKTPNILNCNGAGLSPESCSFQVKVKKKSTLSLYEQALQLKKPQK